MSLSNALVTVVLGEAFEQIWAVARPTFESYAERCHLDLVVIRDVPEGRTPKYAKKIICDLLAIYERVIFVDADVLIRDDAPNLVELVPEDHVGLFEEARFFGSRAQAMSQLLTALGRNADDWLRSDKYYNTGVMVVSRRHAEAFSSLYPEIDNFGEQTHLNYQFWLKRYPIFELDYRLNRMGLMRTVNRSHPLDCFFKHYAGVRRNRVVELMRSDLDGWKSRPLAYQPRHPRVCRAASLCRLE